MQHLILHSTVVKVLCRVTYTKKSLVAIIIILCLNLYTLWHGKAYKVLCSGNWLSSRHDNCFRLSFHLIHILYYQKVIVVMHNTRTRILSTTCIFFIGRKFPSNTTIFEYT